MPFFDDAIIFMDEFDDVKQSVLSSITSVPVGSSRSLARDLLPMLDVSFVRMDNPTVLPYPIKYLREWSKSSGGER